jgi:hypothetical protein
MRMAGLAGVAAVLGAPAAFAATPTVTTLAVTAGGTAVTSVAPGTVVTLTATVTAGGAPVTPGLVNFCDANAAHCTDVHIVGSVQLTSAGTAVYRFRPGGGSHSYKAFFVGTQTYAGSASDASSLASPYSASLGLDLGSGPSPNITASLTMAGLSRGTNLPGTSPTGTVTLTDTTNGGNTVVATPTLTSGPSKFAGVGFGAGQIFSGTFNSQGIATADFNGDGIPDLAFSYQGTGPTVMISLGNGDGSTKDLNPVTLATTAGCAVNGITAGDFNNDGIPDLAAVSRCSPTGSEAVYVITGKGDGTFNPGPLVVDLPDGIGTIKAGDFNGDGNLDLVAVSQTAGGMTLLGNGDGTFQTKTMAFPVYFESGIAVADFNGDGMQDVAVANDVGGVVLLLSNGDGTFTAPPQNPPYVPYCDGIAAGDVNGDGVPDLIAASGAQYYAVLLGKGDGTFTALSQHLPTLNYLQLGSPVIVDFNGDGNPDVAGFDAADIYVYFGAGDGTFQQVLDLRLGTNYTGELVAPDLNGDGVPDVVANHNETTTGFESFAALGALLEFQNQSTATANFTISPGTHHILAQYPGDTNWAAVSQTGSVQYQVSTYLTLTWSPGSGPWTVGQSVTLTGTVHPATQDGASTDGGTVSLTDNGVPLGTGTLSGGVVTFTTPLITGGNNVMKLTYLGSDQFQPSWGSINFLADKVSPTLALTAGPSSVQLGQSITLTATASGGYVPSLPGDVITFTANGAQIGTATLSSAKVATFTWTPSATGPQAIRASFGGDTSNNTATSNYVYITVLKPGQTVTTVTLQVNGSSNPGTVPRGTPAVLTATVTASGSPVAQGTVRFCDVQFQTCGDFAASPTAQLNAAGQATVTTRLGPGPHNLVAYFTGTATAGAAASTPVAISGGPYAAELLQTCQTNWYCTPSLHVSAPLYAPPPTGNVQFLDQSFANNVLGSSMLNGSSLFRPIFTRKSSSATGANPFSIAAADFNHDGWPDVAVTNSGENTVGILLGNGDGTFQPQVTYAVGAGPFAVAVGDFNNDGNPDLAVTNFSANTVSILLGKTDGTFQPQHTFATGGGPVAVVVADFNSDGQLDLAVVNNLDNTVSILLGKGDGSFQPQVTYATGAAPDAIVTADFNSDQTADLAVANNGDSTVSILLGKGDGTFQAQTAYSSGGTNPISLAAGLMSNGGVVDNNVDLVVANTGDGNITILYGNGDGTLLAPQWVYTEPAVQAVSTGTLGDYGSQGLADIAFASSTQSGILLEYAGKYFAQDILQSPASGITALTVADWDGNGVSDYAFLGNTSKAVTVVLNTSLREWDGGNVYLSFNPTAGTHKVVAQYAADSNYPTLTSAPYTFNLGLTPTKLTLAANRNPSNYGDAVTLTATLTPHSNGSVNSDGETIQFSSGSTLLGTGTLASGVATLTTSALPTGIDTVTGTYTADQFFAGATGSMTQTVRPPTLTVTAQNATRTYGAPNPAFTVKVTGAVNGDTFTTSASTTATQTSSPGAFNIVPSISGSSVSNYNVVKVNGTLTVTPAALTVAAQNATRTYGAANPTLTVNVTGAVNGDTFTTSASTTATQTSPPGAYSIVPTVAGSHLADYSVVKTNGTLTVTPATPVISLKSSADQAFTNTAVTFTATVSSSAGAPGGTVSFYDGSTLLNQAPLTAGTATYTTSSLALGTHDITAVYSGDTNFVTVSSPAVSTTVESFTISAPSGGDSATVSPGGTASYTFNVAPPSGTKFLSDIKFSLTGAPTGSTSTFNPASIVAGSAATDVTLKVAVPSSAAAQPAPSPFGTRSLPIALGLLAMPWVLPLRRRAPKWPLVALLAVFGLASLGLLNACGGGSSSGGGGGGGQPQTYTLTVSASSGSLSQTTKLTLTVK